MVQDCDDNDQLCKEIREEKGNKPFSISMKIDPRKTTDSFKLNSLFLMKMAKLGYLLAKMHRANFYIHSWHRKDTAKTQSQK